MVLTTFLTSPWIENFFGHFQEFLETFMFGSFHVCGCTLSFSFRVGRTFAFAHGLGGLGLGQSKRIVLCEWSFGVLWSWHQATWMIEVGSSSFFQAKLNEYTSDCLKQAWHSCKVPIFPKHMVCKSMWNPRAQQDRDWTSYAGDAAYIYIAGHAFQGIGMLCEFSTAY